MRARGRGLSSFRAGALALAAIVIAIYLIVAKDIPFTEPYELKAVFNGASDVTPRTPVRVAGVEVGRVSKVESAGNGSTAALVTMKIEERGLPIHRDAELEIRPRIFLEGNFFVELRPGTPRAPELDSGATIPITQTRVPVQLDQVLGTLTSDSRSHLRDLLRGYGDALAGRPARGEDADQDEATRRETAGESLNDSLERSAEALRGTALVNDAFLGSELHDLSRLVAGQQRVSSALASREEQLKGLIESFNRTTAALASEQRGLRASVRTLPRVLERAGSAFESLNAAFPPTRSFAREILPGVRETPTTIRAAFPWIAQTRRLVSPPELQGLVNDLRPSIGDLAAVTDDTVRLLPEVDLVSRCMIDVVLPTGDVKIDDGALSTGIENYKEFWQGLAGLSSESQNFDGNGQYTRFQPGGGDNTISTGELQGQGALFGNAATPPLGTRPAFPGRKPPYRRDVPCHRNQPPDLNAAPTGPGP